MTGTEPKTMVCKISGLYNRKVSLLWRFIIYVFSGGNADELMTKTEADFFNRIIPQTKDTNLRTPHVYYVGKCTPPHTSFEVVY